MFKVTVAILVLTICSLLIVITGQARKAEPAPQSHQISVSKESAARPEIGSDLEVSESYLKALRNGTITEKEFHVELAQKLLPLVIRNCRNLPVGHRDRPADWLCALSQK